MKLRVIAHNRFSTKGSDGQPNGFLVPIYNVHEGFIRASARPSRST